MIAGFLEGRPETGNPGDLAEAMLSEFGKYKESDIPLEEYEPVCCEKALFVEIAKAYSSAKKEIGKVDFDDLLTGCRDLLKYNPQTLSRWQNRFRYIQCDEYQDTSRIQMDILYMRPVDLPVPRCGQSYHDAVRGGLQGQGSQEDPHEHQLQERFEDSGHG